MAAIRTMTAMPALVTLIPRHRNPSRSHNERRRRRAQRTTGGSDRDDQDERRPAPGRDTTTLVPTVIGRLLPCSVDMATLGHVWPGRKVSRRPRPHNGTLGSPSGLSGVNPTPGETGPPRSSPTLGPPRQGSNGRSMGGPEGRRSLTGGYGLIGGAIRLVQGQTLGGFQP